MQWLTGSVLDDADAALLQVPDRSRLSAASLEAEAREILTSLGLLLTRYQQPLVMCFDRLENLETAEDIDAALAAVEPDTPPSRLVAVPGNEQAETIFPFDSEELLKTFHLGLYSPRCVITLANQRLRQLLDEEPLPPVSPLQELQEAFASQYQAIMRDFERYQPDRGRLRRALELYVQYGPSKCVPTESGQEKYIDVSYNRAPGRDDSCAGIAPVP